MIFVGVVNLLGYSKAFRWVMCKWAGYRWYRIDDNFNEYWVHAWPEISNNKDESYIVWYAFHPEVGVLLMETEGKRPWTNSMVQETYTCGR